MFGFIATRTVCAGLVSVAVVVVVVAVAMLIMKNECGVLKSKETTNDVKMYNWVSSRRNKNYK